MTCFIVFRFKYYAVVLVQVVNKCQSVGDIEGLLRLYVLSHGDRMLIYSSERIAYVKRITSVRREQTYYLFSARISSCTTGYTNDRLIAR